MSIPFRLMVYSVLHLYEHWLLINYSSQVYHKLILCTISGEFGPYIPPPMVHNALCTDLLAPMNPGQRVIHLSLPDQPRMMALLKIELIGNLELFQFLNK